VRWALFALLAACGFPHGSLGADAKVTADAARADPFGDSAPVAPWLPSYGFRKIVRVTPHGTATSLDSFPIAIRIAGDTDLAAHALVDGTDIVVTAEDGTTIRSSELAYYDPATGDAEVWVSIPTLVLDGTTWLHLYYGGAAASSTAPKVWSPGYKGVWHMSGGPLADTEADSTTNAHPITQAVPSSVAGSGVGAGDRGRARAFDGVDDTFSAPDPLDGSLDVGTTDFSVSMWLDNVASTGLYDPPFYKGGTNPGNPGYSVFAGSSGWSGKIMDASGQFINPPFCTTPIYGAWTHIVMSIQRSPSNQSTSYLDAVQVLQFGFNLQNFNDNAGLVIGGIVTYFHGSIDEIRVYDRTLSADWVTTEYANLAAPDFITVGTQQTP
jgi:hypothetical protein